MKNNRSLPGWLAVILTLACFTQPLPAVPLGTAFSYQGRLSSGTNAANGIYDFSFAVYDAAAGGAQQGTTQTTNAVTVTNGYFNVALDFGNYFDGNARWLAISVKTNGAGSYAALSPRIQLMPNPYALYAPSAGAAATASTAASAAAVASGGVGNVSLQAGAVTGDKIASGTITAAAVAPNTFWQTGGNIGTTPGTNFLGTADGSPLELKVNNARVLRLEPGITAPNVVGGYSENSAAGADGAVIAGGGSPGLPNLILGPFNTIGGGRHHKIDSSFGFSTIAGGDFNQIGPDAAFAFIGGGNANCASNRNTVIGGGWGNQALGLTSTVGGGYFNNAGSRDSTIAGGNNLLIQPDSDFAAIGGGSMNSISSNSVAATIGGGSNNIINAGSLAAAIGGGNFNIIGTNAGFSLVDGGSYNVIDSKASASVIGGGELNMVRAETSVIGGGYDNHIDIGAYGSAIPGGMHNKVGAELSLAAGWRANAMHGASFVWADSSGGEFATSGTNQFLIRAVGGVGINTNDPAGAALSISGTVRATAFEGSFSSGGDLTAARLVIGTNQAVTGTYATIAGGRGNTNLAALGVIAGGGGNTILSGELAGVIGGGALNLIGGVDMRIPAAGPGDGNAVVGGVANNIDAGTMVSTIGGGWHNVVMTNVWGSVIGGGSLNLIDENASDATIAGGSGNQIGYSSSSSSIAGGVNNGIETNSAASVIAGGSNNVIQANASYATVAGGMNNLSGDWFATVGGGGANTASNDYATVSGGAFNMAVGNGSAVPGGYLNLAAGLYSFAAGQQAKAQHNGAFVWADATGVDFPSTADNQFLIRAAGNVGINKNNPGTALDVNGTVTATSFNGSGVGLTGVGTVNLANNAVTSAKLASDTASLSKVSGGKMTCLAGGNVGIGTNSPQTKLHVVGDVLFTSGAGFGANQSVAWTPGSGSWTFTSDRSTKEKFAPVDGQSVLEKVASLPLSEWNYIGYAQRHIGPMAQDFHAQFPLNESDTTLNDADLHGVALAAIQGLNKKLEQKDAEIEALQQSVAELKKMVQSLAEKK